jgi:hypothetical protein
VVEQAVKTGADRTKEAGDVNNPAVFPVTVHLESEETIYQTVSELETDLEFFNTDDPTVTVIDAEGVKVRLRVWALELGLCQRMLEGEEEGSFRISSMTVSGQSGFAEVSNADEAIRRAFTSSDAWPSTWNAEFADVEFTRRIPASMNASEFDNRWLDIRFGR